MVMMMSFRMVPSVSLIFLLMMSGVVANDWGVIYKSTSICALKGSTVIMSCTYTYPSDHTVITTFWSKKQGKGHSEPHDLSLNPEYTNRTENLGDKQMRCKLKLSDVREEDQSEYYFRFTTDKANKPGKWQNQEAVALSVTGLQVEAPERVIEGDEVTLTCNTSCSLPDSPTFIWCKDGQQLTSSNTSRLHLQQVSSEDAGRYNCSVLGHRHHSPAVTPQVLYSPKNVSVSISSSGVLVEGSSVNLTCSSDANPPVVNYTWYKDNENSPVGSGQSYSFDFSSSTSGRYHCEAQNVIGSRRSDAVLVANVQQTVLHYAVALVVVVCVAFLLIACILLKRRKRRAESARDPKSTQNNLCSGKTLRTSTPDHNLANQDEVQYTSVVHRSASNPSNAERCAATGEDAEEVQYATIQRQCEKRREKSRTETLQFSPSGPSNRSTGSTLEDLSTIYSGVK